MPRSRWRGTRRRWRGRWSRIYRSLILCHRRGRLMADHVRAARYQRSRNRRQPPRGRTPAPSSSRRQKNRTARSQLRVRWLIPNQPFGAQFQCDSRPYSRRRFFACRQCSRCARDRLQVRDQTRTRRTGLQMTFNFSRKRAVCLAVEQLRQSLLHIGTRHSLLSPQYRSSVTQF